MDLDINGDQVTKFEFAELPLSESVVQAVAKAEDIDPTELPPLYNQVDADALETLFQNPSNGVFAFDYHGFTVLVRADGSVFLR